MTANAFGLEIEDVEDHHSGVKWVITDAYGILLEASREAARMLNLSRTGMRSRQLLVFFDGEREHWRQALRAAAGGLMVDQEGAVRPRDKRPVRVRAEITRAHDWVSSNTVLWTFTDAEAPRDNPRPHRSRHRRSSEVDTPMQRVR